MMGHRLPYPHFGAVGASVVTHVAVALGVAMHQPATEFRAEPQPVVNVSLVDAADLVPVHAPPASSRQPAKQAGTPASDPRAPPAPRTFVSAAAVASATAPAAPAAIEPSRPAQVSEVRPVFAAAPAPAVDLLAEHRRRVWAHLARSAPAARPGAGVAVVVFVMDESGAVLSVRLARSSGDPLFDRACLRAIRAAAPLPAPPPGTRPDQLIFELPIHARRA